MALARITGVVGVGCNYVKFGVEVLRSSFKDEIPVKRMIVSFSPEFLAFNASSVSSSVGS